MKTCSSIVSWRYLWSYKSVDRNETAIQPPRARISIKTFTGRGWQPSCKASQQIQNYGLYCVDLMYNQLRAKGLFDGRGELRWLQRLPQPQKYQTELRLLKIPDKIRVTQFPEYPSKRQTLCWVSWTAVGEKGAVNSRASSSRREKYIEYHDHRS